MIAGHDFLVVQGGVVDQAFACFGNRDKGAWGLAGGVELLPQDRQRSVQWQKAAGRRQESQAEGGAGNLHPSC